MSYKAQIIENFNTIFVENGVEDVYLDMDSRIFQIYFSMEEKKELEIIHEKDPFKKLELRRLNDLRIQHEILCAKRLKERDEEESRKENDDECSCVHQDDESVSNSNEDDYVEGENARSYDDSTSNLVVYIKPKILDKYMYEVEGTRKEEKKLMKKVLIRRVNLNSKKKKLKKKKRKSRSIHASMLEVMNFVNLVQKEVKFEKNSRIGGEMVVYKERSEKKFVWKNEIFCGICVPNKRKIKNFDDNDDFGGKIKCWRKKEGQNSKILGTKGDLTSQ